MPNFLFNKLIDARLATKISFIANQFEATSTLVNRRGTADLKSAIQIMNLKLNKGDRCKITFEGKDSEKVYQNILELFLDEHIASKIE